ncbi:hypothetical protein F4803DRAFT_179841 [Xylaria telfairii]|nr:hypothetical protein F4803DRAFT_179841 [Xylaria telfairii]
MHLPLVVLLGITGSIQLYEWCGQIYIRSISLLSPLIQGTRRGHISITSKLCSGCRIKSLLCFCVIGLFTFHPTFSTVPQSPQFRYIYIEVNLPQLICHITTIFAFPVLYLAANATGRSRS